MAGRIIPPNQQTSLSRRRLRVGREGGCMGLVYILVVCLLLFPLLSLLNATPVIDTNIDHKPDAIPTLQATGILGPDEKPSTDRFEWKTIEQGAASFVLLSLLCTLILTSSSFAFIVLMVNPGRRVPRCSCACITQDGFRALLTRVTSSCSRDLSIPTLSSVWSTAIALVLT